MSDSLEDTRNIPTGQIHFPRSYETSSGYSSSSPSSSPKNTLKRSRSSSFHLMNRRVSTISTGSSQFSLPPEQDDLADFIGWYPSIVLRILADFIFSTAYLVITRLPFILPTLWLSANLWVFWKCLQLPLTIMKYVMDVLQPSKRDRKKRTVLISGGSTVQAIHLARNFYSVGARVLVCEVEGLIGLAKYSTAVDRTYVVPKPNMQSVDLYIAALRNIVISENVTYYLPVCEGSSAYFDALAKPILESAGCECFCPDAKIVSILDDNFEFVTRAQAYGSATPEHYLVRSVEDVTRLYDLGMLERKSHYMVPVGLEGYNNRRKVKLPNSKRRLRLNPSPNDISPWLIIRDYSNHRRFVTCTTVRDCQVIANVTCPMDSSENSLEPIQHEEIEKWLDEFFSNLKHHPNVVGQFCFSFAVSASSRGGVTTIIPLECQIGVRLPYICYTNVHAKILWKPCHHFSRKTSGPLVVDAGRYWLHEMVLSTLKRPNVENANKLFDAIFVGKEALFAIWDPLPYCAYYYLQLPVTSLSKTYLSRLLSATEYLVTAFVTKRLKYWTFKLQRFATSQKHSVSSVNVVEKGRRTCEKSKDRCRI